MVQEWCYNDIKGVVQKKKHTHFPIKVVSFFLPQFLVLTLTKVAIYI